MSELYMIVLQGKEELGNDPEAIKLWSELSGVDIESINENTPFDIEIADKLLRTLPEVLEKLKEKKKVDVEKVEKALETLMKEKESKEKSEEKEGILEVLKKEFEKSHIFEEIEETEKEEVKEAIPVEEKPVEGISVPKGVKFVLEFSGGKFSKIYGDWKDLGVLNSLLSQNLRSFHMGYIGNFTIYGEKIGNKWIIIGVDEGNLGVVKVVFSSLRRNL